MPSRGLCPNGGRDGPHTAGSEVWQASCEDLMDLTAGKMGIRRVAPPGATERLLAVSVMLLESGAFSTLSLTEGQISIQAGGSVVWQIFWVLVYMVTLGLLYRHCSGFLRQIFQAWPLVAFVALAVLSTMWSHDPGLTFRRGFALSFSVVFGFYLAKRFSLREQLHLLAWVCGICIFFSTLFQLLHVGSAVSNMAGAWYGVFVDKSIFGLMMALSVLVFMLLAKAEPRRRWPMRLALLSALVLMLLSRSVTPLVATVLMFILLPLSGILRKSFGKAVAGMVLVSIVGMAALFWVFTHWGVFTTAVGRGPTMSGRLQLWALCVVVALRKPWFGYGYGAFWFGTDGPSWRIWKAMGVWIAHAHNEFLQTWLDLGLVGVALLLLILALYIIRAANLVRRTRQPEAVWPLMLFAFLFLFMLTKIPLPEGKSLSMTIFCSCMFAVSSPILAKVEERLPKPSRRRVKTGVAPGMGSAEGAGVV